MTKNIPVLRSELEGIGYLETHPEVAEFFKRTGVFSYYEKLDTFHQQIVEAFAVTFDGRSAKIGKEEFIDDEAAIHECTGLPRIGECWFKTTTPSNIEFRSYLLPVHSDIIWKKIVSMSFLKPEWQALLKTIIAYITCEGRYNRAMLYHFKLLNHFTGKDTINLPFYLHKSLTKMAKQVRAEPTKLTSRLSHHGLITLLVKESLRKRQMEWDFFLFWNEFPTNLDKKGKKTSPKSSTRKRRAMSPPPQKESPSSSKGKRSKRKLVFDKKTPVSNPLNFPYSDSESETEHQEELNTQETTEPEEQDVDLSAPTPPEEQELAKDKQTEDTPSTSQSNKINQLLKELYNSKHAEK